MKTIAKFSKIMITTVFTLIFMLFTPGKLEAQVNMNKNVDKSTYKAELLFASLEQNSPGVYIFASLNEALETVAIENWMLDPEVFIDRAVVNLDELANEVSKDENIQLEEWMKTDFSYSAQKIECQPLSVEPALEVEDWMVTESAWTLEK